MTNKTNKVNKSYNTNKQNKVQGAMDIFTGHYILDIFMEHFCNNGKISKNKLNKTNNSRNKLKCHSLAPIFAPGPALGPAHGPARQKCAA